jgi:hypothetical protein
MIADFLTGIPSEFTPAQKTRLDEMERDYQEFVRQSLGVESTKRAVRH